jgi:hypothetical protein
VVPLSCGDASDSISDILSEGLAAAMVSGSFGLFASSAGTDVGFGLMVVLDTELLVVFVVFDDEPTVTLSMVGPMVLLDDPSYMTTQAFFWSAIFLGA